MVCYTAVMNKQEMIAEFAIRSSLVKDPKVSFLAGGFGNENYLIQEGDLQYVLRLKKSDESQFRDSLEREYIFLKYYNECGVVFCPKALYFDSRDNYLIESFLPGKLTLLKDFTNEQVDQFARQLASLFHLSVPDFYVFCTKNNLRKYKQEDPISLLQKYGFERLAEAKRYGFSGESAAWLEGSLNENLEYFENQSVTAELGFSWGDVQSSLIIGPGDEMYFYDFEHTVISDFNDLAYIKIHSGFDSRQLEYFVERCAKYLNRSTDSLIFSMNASEKAIRTNDAIWAAWQWSQTGDASFEQMLHERIALVKGL